MELFRGYQTDFDDQANEAESSINALHGLTGDDLRRKQGEIQGAINEARQVISSMQVALPQVTNKQQAQDVIDKCNLRLKELAKRYKTASETAQGKNDRLSLLGATDAESLASVQARTSVLSDTDTLRKGEDQLTIINQNVTRMGVQGAETLNVMSEQRERMEGQRSRLDGVRMKLRDSERLIRAIGARMSVNDFMKLGIMLILIILIFVIIYLRWIRRIVKINPPSSPPAGFEPYAPVAPVPADPPAVVERWFAGLM